nr:hypothetical protein [Deltaproteobacteria bacterium]
MSRMTTLTTPLIATAALAVFACEVSSEDPEFDARAASLEEPVDEAKPDESAKSGTLMCEASVQTTVGGLHYLGLDCAAAIADAEVNLGGWHYRNGCHEKVGSDIDAPAEQAVVTDCYISGDYAVVTVDLCCNDPGPSCEEDEQAAVEGLYYPGLDCAEATLHAEANLDGWHYRNGCNKQVGSDIDASVNEAVVTECHMEGDSAVVAAVLCCTEPVLSCDEELHASVGGLYYPGLDCAAAIADAESDLGSWHYRNGCTQQVGSDIGTPVDEALVTEYHMEGDSAVVAVDVCCAEPVLDCGVEEQ